MPYTVMLILNSEITRDTLYVQRNIEVRLCNHCFSGKAISIKYCESVFVALGIRHANPIFLRRIIISFVACLAVPFFSKLPHKWQYFRNKGFKHNTCVFCFVQLLSEIFLTVRIQQDIIIILHIFSL